MTYMMRYKTSNQGLKKFKRPLKLPKAQRWALLREGAGPMATLLCEPLSMKSLMDLAQRPKKTLRTPASK